MKLADAWVAWTATSWELPSAGNVFVGTKEQVVARIDTGEARSWVPVGRAMMATDRLTGEAEEWAAKALMMTCFHTMVVRDGVSPEAAHKAFLIIDEYRRLISRDIEGAEDAED